MRGLMNDRRKFLVDAERHSGDLDMLAIRPDSNLRRHPASAEPTSPGSDREPIGAVVALSLIATLSALTLTVAREEPAFAPGLYAVVDASMPGTGELKPVRP